MPPAPSKQLRQAWRAGGGTKEGPNQQETTSLLNACSPCCRYTAPPTKRLHPCVFTQSNSMSPLNHPPVESVHQVALRRRHNLGKRRVVAAGRCVADSSRACGRSGATSKHVLLSAHNCMPKAAQSCHADGAVCGRLCSPGHAVSSAQADMMKPYSQTVAGSPFMGSAWEERGHGSFSVGDEQASSKVALKPRRGLTPIPPTRRSLSAHARTHAALTP